MSKIRILFLCTGNSARSVLAEATLASWSRGRFEVFSAGSKPAGFVHPLALAQLSQDGIATIGLRSKSWDEFAQADSQSMDLVVTVCDSAAAETCPVVFGDFIRTHWGMADPAAVLGSELEKAQAFQQAHALVKTRLLAMLALPADVWRDRARLKLELDRIGFMETADASDG